MASVLESYRPLTPNLYAWNIPQSKRRRIQVSDTRSWDGPEDGLSALNHTYEYCRVGTPALVMLPLMCYNYPQRNAGYEKFMSQEVQNDIQDILQEYDIKVENGIDGLLWLRNLDDSNPDEARPTLYIQTPRYQSFVPENQRQCVAQLFYYLDRKDIRGPKGEIITVEIIGHKLWAPRNLAHVEIGHPFLQKWHAGLSEKLVELIKRDRYMAGKVHSMNVLRLGFDMEDSTKNPVVLTITVDYSLDPPAWRDLYGSMLDCFKTEHVDDFPIEFERGEVFLSANRREEPKMAGLKPGQIECPYVRPGSIISPVSIGDTEPKPVGTAGVVLEILKAGTTEVLTTVVLTNHHVVRTALKGFVMPQPPSVVGEITIWRAPVKGSICEKVDNHGYSVLAQQYLAKDISPCVFRSPNVGAIKFTVSTLEAEIARLSVYISELEGEALEEIEEDIEKVRRLIRKVQDPEYPVQQLGCVWYSGGLSRKVYGLGGRLDVAAISLENEAALNASNDISHRANEWKQIDRPRVTAIKDIDTNFGKATFHHCTKPVFRIGAMTGCTTGTICSDTRSKVRFGWHPEKDMTDEISIVGDGDPYTDMFSWKGDSGAAIFTVGGKWLGLLCGGQTVLNSPQLLTYVIPASAIIADMVELSGFKIDVRLKA